MSEPVRTHPETEQLTAFALGRLVEEESVMIEDHLAGCATCRTAVEAAGDDSLVSLLRGPTESAGGATTGDETLSLAPVPSEVPAELAGHARYRVQGLLGVGGMGAVYKAEHQLMERLVALKVINRGLTSNPAAVERFRREVKAAARLTHPNIVTAFDADHTGDTHFLVMEYVEGTSLARLVAEKGPLPVAQACDYVRQAALGLQHAHEQGMVHRDVKPQNLMLTPQGQVKILDFGLARLALENVPTEAAADAASRPGASTRPTGSLTEMGVVMGTPDYLAPEQAADPHAADIRADIYSLGCTLYDILAGHAPFPEGTALQKVMAHAQQKARPLDAIRKDVPPRLARVVAKMMAKDPARRYQTPAEVAEALAPFAGIRRKRSPWRVLLPLAAGLLVCVLGLAQVFGATLYRVATNQGELVVEIDDPNVKVVLDQAGVTVRDLATKREYHLELKPAGHDLPAGEYELEVTEGEGIKLFTQQFVLFRGGKTAVNVSLDVASVDRARLQGTWVVASSQMDGPPGNVNGDYVLITGTTFSVKTINGRDGDATYQLDPTAQPRRIDMEQTAGPGAGTKVGGIYSLDRDVLNLCFVEPGGSRPANFVFQPGKHMMLMTLRRVSVSLAPGEVRRFEGHTGSIKSVAFSPDGKRVLSGSGYPTTDNTARVWEVATGKELICFRGHEERVSAVAFSPDGKLALTGGSDKALRLWEVATGKEVRRFRGHTGGIGAVVFSRDGKLAASAGWDKTVRPWDVATGQELKKFEGPTNFQTVVFFPDGKRVLFGGDDRIMRLGDVATGQEIRRFEGHKQIVSCVAVSPDGRRALATDDGVRLWDLETGQVIRTFEEGSAHVESVAFSPDGRRALAGGQDHTVRVWDVETGEKLAFFKGPGKGVFWSVAFSPDGRFALSGSGDNTLRLWRLPEPGHKP
jgi:uncharacterized protein (TIGR03067 family)